MTNTLAPMILTNLFALGMAERKVSTYVTMILSCKGLHHISHLRGHPCSCTFSLRTTTVLSTHPCCMPVTSLQTYKALAHWRTPVLIATLAECNSTNVWLLKSKWPNLNATTPHKKDSDVDQVLSQNPKP